MLKKILSVCCFMALSLTNVMADSPDSEVALTSVHTLTSTPPRAATASGEAFKTLSKAMHSCTTSCDKKQWTVSSTTEAPVGKKKPKILYHCACLDEDATPANHKAAERIAKACSATCAKDEHFSFTFLNAGDYHCRCTESSAH